jgi:hypothetical protein
MPRSKNIKSNTQKKKKSIKKKNTKSNSNKQSCPPGMETVKTNEGILCR